MNLKSTFLKISFWIVFIVTFPSLPLFGQQLPFIIKVVSIETLMPIANVEVVNIGKKKFTRTDSNGIARLENTSNQSIQLRIKAGGFVTVDTTVQNYSKDTLIIRLSEEMQSNMYKVHALQKNVVVTATRTATSKEDSPLNISVIDSKQLQQTQSVTLAEGLQYQQGIRLENNCQNCGTTQIRINGLEGPYSQILIDSKPIFSTVSGVYGLEQIPTSMIESIEILRGGASSMYGGNAVGGVINVLTKEPLTNTLEFSSNGTSFGSGAFELTSQLYGTLVNEDFTSGLTLYGTSRQRDPLDINGDGFSELAQLRQHTIGTKFNTKLSDEINVKVGYTFINEDRRGGNKFELEPHQSDITEWIASSTHFGSASLDIQTSSTSTLGFYSGLSVVDRESYYGANQDTNAYGTTDNQLLLLGTSYTQSTTSELFGNHLFTSGIEFQYEGLKDIALGYNRNIRQYVRQLGFYFQDNIQFNSYFDAIVGVRIDRHSMVNNLMINPRFSIKYTPLPTIALRGNFSTGYRAPQAFNEDLHIQVVNGDLQIHIPGANLREERSKSYSFNLEHRYTSSDFNVVTSVEAFYTSLDGVFVYNNIGKDALGNQIFERVNGNNSVVNGVTFEVTSNFGSLFSMRASLTTQQNSFSNNVVWSEREVEIPGQGLTLVQQSSNQFLRTPNNYGFFSMSIGPFSNFLTSISGVYTGSMQVPWYQENQDILVKTENFYDVMIKGEYSPQFLQGFEISAGVFNIFQSYQPIFDSGINRDAGFTYGPIKPRSAFIGIRYSLQ